MRLTRELPSFTIHEFFKKKRKYCLIIPIINEGEKFKKQLASLKPYLSLVDIIIADGGSSDGSTQKSFLRKCGVRTLLTKTSNGKLGTQLRMAFAYAMDQDYQGVITMDGNGKDSPQTIPKFITYLANGFDYIQASRFIKGGKAVNTPFARLIGIRFILSPILSLAAGKWYTDTSNGFRAFSRQIFFDQDILLFRNVFVRYELLFYLTVRTTQLGYKTIEIPAIRSYPITGTVPTKILGIKANWNIIWTASKVLLGIYHPKIV